MIKGLYEAHLPVSNLEVSIEFYEKLGLKMAWRDEETVFFWIEEGRAGLVFGKSRRFKPHTIRPCGILPSVSLTRI